MRERPEERTDKWMRERPEEGETKELERPEEGEDRQRDEREQRGGWGENREKNQAAYLSLVLRGERVGLRGRREAPLPPDEGKPLIIKFLLNSNHFNSNSLFCLLCWSCLMMEFCLTAQGC